MKPMIEIASNFYIQENQYISHYISNGLLKVKYKLNYGGYECTITSDLIIIEL